MLAELSTQPIAVDGDGLILRVGDYVAKPTPWAPAIAGVITEILGDGWVLVASVADADRPGPETCFTDFLTLLGQPQRCVAKVGEPFHMTECGRLCIYLDLRMARALDVGENSGWYHIPLSGTGDHYAVPKGFIR